MKIILWLLLLSSSYSSYATITATQITVLKASRYSTTVQPGQIMNVGANFNATSPASKDYALDIYLVDSSNTVQATFQNDLNYYLTIIPTTSWKGPITITTAITVPSSLALGTYKIMVSLLEEGKPVQLTGGAGVPQYNQLRYAVGEVVVTKSVPKPNFLAPHTLDTSTYKLTFDDEFTTLSLSDSSTNDGSNWYTLNEQCCLESSDGSGTYMVGLSSPYDPYSLINGGGLDIRLQEISDNWYSGVLTSVDSVGTGFSQEYGYFEMKAKFPTGIDTWPAFWLLNTAAKSSGAAAAEIDVTEYINNPGFPNYQATTLHDWSNGSTPAASHNEVPFPDSSYHTYGMLWTSRTMTFYYDGSITFQCQTPAAMHQSFYLLVDLGLGAGWPTNNTPAVNDMLIQYVRAYSVPN